MNATVVYNRTTDLVTNSYIVAGASASSILALILTILIYFRLQKINNQLVLYSRRERWLRSLRDSASQIARQLSAEGGEDAEIRDILVQVRPTLKALKKCLPIRSDKRLQILMLLSKIGRYLGDGVLRLLMISRARDRMPHQIYESLLELNETLKEDIAQADVYRAKV